MSKRCWCSFAEAACNQGDDEGSDGDEPEKHLRPDCTDWPTFIALDRRGSRWQRWWKWWRSASPRCWPARDLCLAPRTGGSLHLRVKPVRVMIALHAGQINVTRDTIVSIWHANLLPI